MVKKRLLRRVGLLTRVQDWGSTVKVIRGLGIHAWAMCRLRMEIEVVCVGLWGEGKGNKSLLNLKTCLAS